MPDQGEIELTSAVRAGGDEFERAVAAGRVTTGRSRSRWLAEVRSSADSRSRDTTLGWTVLPVSRS